MTQATRWLIFVGLILKGRQYMGACGRRIVRHKNITHENYSRPYIG